MKKISRIKDEIGLFLHIISDRNIPADDVYEQINLRLDKYVVLPKEDNAEETVKLGRDAIALLVTVCNASGILQISTSLESYSILIDCNNFVDCSSLDNRTIARWKEALKKLETYGLIETDDNVLYRVTQSGYNASDDLEKQIGTEKVRCNNCHYHGASDKKNKCPICNCEIGGREEIILDAIRKDSTVTRKQLSELLSCSEQTVLNVLNSLSEKGIIERVSSNRGASWKIK